MNYYYLITSTAIQASSRSAAHCARAFLEAGVDGLSKNNELRFQNFQILP
jgi:hypothetical protein